MCPLICLGPCPRSISRSGATSRLAVRVLLPLAPLPPLAEPSLQPTGQVWAAADPAGTPCRSGSGHPRGFPAQGSPAMVASEAAAAAARIKMHVHRSARLFLNSPCTVAQNDSPAHGFFVRTCLCDECFADALLTSMWYRIVVSTTTHEISPLQIGQAGAVLSFQSTIRWLKHIRHCTRNPLQNRTVLP